MWAINWGNCKEAHIQWSGFLELTEGYKLHISIATRTDNAAILNQTMELRLCSGSFPLLLLHPAYRHNHQITLKADLTEQKIISSVFTIYCSDSHQATHKKQRPTHCTPRKMARYAFSERHVRQTEIWGKGTRTFKLRFAGLFCSAIAINFGIAVRRFSTGRTKIRPSLA